MPGFLVQTITLIGYLSRQVNESPPHIWLATPTHRRVYYSQPGVSRLQQIWFSELAVLCGLGLNGPGWCPLECGDLWVLPKYGPQLALMQLSANPLTNSRDVRVTILLLSLSPVMFVEMWWGDTRQHRPLIFISSELTVLCLFLAEVFLMFKFDPRCLWLISSAWLQVFK